MSDKINGGGFGFPPPPPPVERLDSIFGNIDSNKDGMIDKSEFRTATQQFAKILGTRFSETMADTFDLNIDEAFSKQDKDSDGLISKEEFSEFIEDQREVAREMMAQRMAALGLNLFPRGDLSQIIPEDENQGQV